VQTDLILMYQYNSEIPREKNTFDTKMNENWISFGKGLDGYHKWKAYYYFTERGRWITHPVV